MLHILLHSPFKISISNVITFVQLSDDIICIQDGVYLGLKNNFFLKKILNNFNKIYFLKEDVYARGLSKFMDKNIQIIDYFFFVKLTAIHKNSITW